MIYPEEEKKEKVSKKATLEKQKHKQKESSPQMRANKLFTNPQY